MIESIQRFAIVTPKVEMVNGKMEQVGVNHYALEAVADDRLLIERNGERKIVKFKTEPYSEYCYQIQKTQVKSKHSVRYLIGSLADDWENHQLSFIISFINKTMETTKGR